MPEPGHAFARSMRLVDHLPRRGKQLLMVAWDAGSAVVCLWAAFALRLGTVELPVAVSVWEVMAAGIIVPPIFWAFGLYREITRYIGPRYAWLLLQACVVVAAVLLLLTLVAPGRGSGIPRTAPLIGAILLLGAAGGARLMARRFLRISTRTRNSLAILGASDVGAGLAAALGHDRMSAVVAFFDDNPSLAGGAIRGIRIYPLSAFDAVRADTGFSSLLVAVGPKSRARCREALEHAAAVGVRVLAVPTLAEINDGRVNVDALRPLAIEDLLGRASVEPDAALVGANVIGKTVLITGAGGSIGSELCRQVLALNPKALILVDNGEFNLFQIDSQLSRSKHSLAPGSAQPAIHRYLASVTDHVRIDRIMEQHHPDTIYHAAAYKHVPIVEDNEPEGAEVNVLGTLRVAEAALKHGVQDMVFVSTDKAVRPTSVMGASKRVAEMTLQALHARYGGKGKTRFTMVRFGNVLGSSGSVVPIFKEQILAGGPVTVTHPEVTRYFMTIPEAVQLILQAGAMGEGGDVFVLDMGEPVRIFDMARNMIRLSGRSIRDAANPTGDIEILFTGMRPGEKLYEELVIGAELMPTQHAGILRAREAFTPWDVFEHRLQQLEAAVSQHDRVRVRELVMTTGLGNPVRTA